MSKKEQTKPEETKQEMEEKAPVVEQVAEQEPDYKDKYLRLLADVDNIRKNSAKQISNAYTMANEKLLKEMIPYMDSLDLAVDNASDSDTGYIHIRKQLFDILGKFGLKQLEIKEGDQFDESVMNAIMLQPVAETEMNNKIAAITKKGYSLNDNIIRYADVVVYSAPLPA